MLSAAVKGGRPPTPAAPGVCAVTAHPGRAVLVASITQTHTAMSIYGASWPAASEFVYKLSAIWCQIIVEVNINTDLEF